MDQTADQVGRIWSEPGPASSRWEEVDLKEFLSILRRRKWLIAGTTALITGLTALYVFTTTPRYTATLQLVFDPTEQQVINFDAAISGQPQDEATLLSEIEVLKSRDVALRVINKLGLDKDPEFNEGLIPPGPVAQWLARIPPRAGAIRGFCAAAPSSRYEARRRRRQLYGAAAGPLSGGRAAHARAGADHRQFRRPARCHSDRQIPSCRS